MMSSRAPWPACSRGRRFFRCPRLWSKVFLARWAKPYCSAVSASSRGDCSGADMRFSSPSWALPFAIRSSDKSLTCLCDCNHSPRTPVVRSCLYDFIAIAASGRGCFVLHALRRVYEIQDDCFDPCPERDFVGSKLHSEQQRQSPNEYSVNRESEMSMLR